MKGVSRQDVVEDTLRHWDILLLRVQCFLKVARLGFYMMMILTYLMWVYDDKGILVTIILNS